MVDDPAGRRPRVRAPENLPRRRPARPRLRPPHRPDGRSDGPQRGGARRGAADAALPRPRLVAAPSREGPQAARHGAEGTRLHLPDETSPDGRHHDGRVGHRRSRRAEGLPLGAGRGDMEGRPPGSRNGPGAGRRGLGLVAVEEGPQAGGGPDPHTGEGLPHRLRRGDTGRRRPARRHGAASRQGASRSGGRRLPTLRQPRRGAVQGRQGPARRPRPGDAAPRRPRPVRRAQRPRRPRGGLPCGTRPAPETRRPWWSGPAPGRSAHRQRE